MDQVCDPAEVAANAQMVSITQAFAIDLTGQVCVDQFEGEFYGGVSTQAGFVRGAARSPWRFPSRLPWRSRRSSTTPRRFW